MFHGGALIVHGEISRVYRSIEVPYSRKSQTFLPTKLLFCFVLLSHLKTIYSCLCSLWN